MRQAMKFRLSSLLLFVIVVAVVVCLAWEVVLLRHEITRVRGEHITIRNEIAEFRNEIDDARRQFQIMTYETTRDMEQSQRRLDRGARNSDR
jgi:cell division protein FtsL